ncbi:MAG: DUF1289 domain-containing protein, partial [Hyphomicrobium sp.]
MKIPSPCIDVCKFKNAGHCIGCGMTKKQKKSFKRLKGKKAKRQFIDDLQVQQVEIGLKADWARAYRRRCEKKGVACPIDRARDAGPSADVNEPAR